MILKLSRRSLLTAIVLTSVCFLACSCRTPLTRKPVDLGKARMTSSHVDIVIDGKESSQEEWMDSVAVPLKPNGQRRPQRLGLRRPS